MYQLGLLDSPVKDLWKLMTLTAIGGYFGLFFATPCKLNGIAIVNLTLTLISCTVRKFFIILVARDLRLIFPTPSATAITIRDMHQAVDNGASIPRRKMRLLGFAFAFATIFRVLSQFAVGILWVCIFD